MTLSRKEFLKLLGLGLVLSGCKVIRELEYPEQNNYFFPAIQNNHEFSGYMGLQVDAPVAGYEQFIIPNRVYQSPLVWKDIEKTKGVYEFPSWIDYNVEVFRSVGADFIFGTRTCPAWARLWTDKTGSPPKPVNYIDYVNFLSVVIERYQPKAVALWNEPDVITEIDNSLQEYFGAWVIDNDFETSGKRYGEFCAFVYDKLCGCETKLFAGELVGTEYSLKFLNGALFAGLEADYLSYHKYIYNRTQFNDIFDYAQTLRSMTSMPLVVTETNKISDTGGEEHEQIKAEYVQYIYDRIMWEELDIIQFYSLDNQWRNTAFCPNKIPTPAYNVWKGL